MTGFDESAPGTGGPLPGDAEDEDAAGPTEGALDPDAAADLTGSADVLGDGLEPGHVAGS